MARQEKDQMGENIVRKLTTGVSLNDDEKLYLTECDGGMVEVLRILDEKRAANGSVAMSNNDLLRARPEAMKALEQGRRVFEREFGISLAKG